VVVCPSERTTFYTIHLPPASIFPVIFREKVGSSVPCIPKGRLEPCHPLVLKLATISRHELSLDRKAHDQVQQRFCWARYHVQTPLLGAATKGVPCRVPILFLFAWYRVVFAALILSSLLNPP